jgi:hypothetical protein
MEVKNVALILRKQNDGKLLIVGSALEIPIEITDDEEYLFLCDIEIKPKHIFHEYQKDKGNTPNKLLVNGALNWENYKNKIKMKTLIIFLFLSLSCKGQQVDKVAHFGVGYITSATTSALANKQSPWKSITIGIGSAFAVGTVKELYDCSKGGKFNFKDLGWTTFGGGLGAVTIRFTIRSTI